MLSLVLALVLSLVALARAGAQASPYVPNLDPAYEDLDGLVAAGWVKTEIGPQRPYSRLAVARLVIEARDHVARNPAARQSRFSEALARLERAFAPEIRSGCASRVKICAALPGLTLRSASADVTWADSPGRAIPTSYDSVGSSSIDAVLNPLLQKNEGRVLADGATFGAEAVVDFTFGGYISGQLHPRVWNAAPRGATASNMDATFQEAYVRALFHNLSAEVGRNHVADGYGREAGPILSRNARGLDLFRLSFERPVVLPFFLRAVGPLNASALIADMGANSDTPHSQMVVFTGSIHPRRNLELGATLLSHFGGTGIPEVTFLQRLGDVFFIYPQGDAVSDKALGASVRVTIPSVRTQLYVDMMTTDDHHYLKFASQALVTEAVWTGGAKVTGLGADGRTDLWAEARRSGVRPYTHSALTSGLTLDGRIIGDAMGPLGSGATAGVDWRGSRHTFSLSAASERYSGADRYAHASTGDIAWTRIVDRPDETRLRILTDWSTDAGANRVGTSVRIGYEHVTRVLFTGSSRSNLLAQVRIDYRR